MVYINRPSQVAIGETDVSPKPIQICISNVVRHQLVEKVKQLIGEGYPVKVEKCLDLCGSCRYSPQFVFKGKIHQVDDALALDTAIRQLLPETKRQSIP